MFSERAYSNIAEWNTRRAFIVSAKYWINSLFIAACSLCNNIILIARNPKNALLFRQNLASAEITEIITG